MRRNYELLDGEPSRSFEIIQFLITEVLTKETNYRLDDILEE